MMNSIKINKNKWESNKPSTYKINQLSYMGFDTSINIVNDKLKNTSYITGFSYSGINNRIRKANELLEQLCYYIGATLDDINDLIDEPFFQSFDNKIGILEKFEKINLNQYKTKNNLGIKQHSSYSYNDYYTKQNTKVDYSYEKDKIGFADIFNNSELKGYKGMPSFAEMMKDQYKNEVANNNLDIAYDDYVESLLYRSDIHHTVDRGWLNFLSDALDTVGIVSAVAFFTGENFITGEILTKEERDRAVFDTIVNVTLLATTILTAGTGSIAAVGTKAAIKQTAKNATKALAIDMISGVAGLAAINILDNAGAPKWLSIIAGLGVSFTAGYYGNKKFVDTVPNIKESAIDDLIQQTGLSGDQLSDIMKYSKLDAAELADALKKGDLLDIIQGRNIDFNKIDIDDYNNAVKSGIKPENSRTFENWSKKGGIIEINKDGTTWRYTDIDGNVVYYRDGFPDFYSYKHPNVDPVSIKISQPKDNKVDVKKANMAAGLGPNSNPPVYDLKKPPKGYTWHHMEDGKTMILVKKDIHKLFTHKGGQSIINGKGV